MLRRKLVENLCIAVVSLAVFNQIAVFLHWYEIVWWFDMPMHFLGGLSVFYFSAIVWLPARKWVPDWRFLYEAVITTVLIGVLWEALELYLFLHYGSPNFITLDSFSDVFFDLAGAFLGAYLVAPLLVVESSKSKV
jgi:hypothetical protein